MKNIIYQIELVLILTILFSGLAFAWGVASANGPVTIYPGEVKVFPYWIQNMVDPNDIYVRAEVTGGKDIASIIGNTTYLVRTGTKDTEVPIQIMVPKNVSVNTTYVVTVSYATITPGDPRAIALGTGIGSSFEVLVVAKEVPKIVTYLPYIVVIAVIIIIIIVIILLRRKKKE